MRHSKWEERLRRFLFLLLVILAFASVAFALRPLIFRVEKTKEIQRETQKFYAAAEQTQEQLVEQEEIPYERLLTAFQRHNQWLYDVKQANLTGPEAYAESLFDLTDYGLPDQTFGVINIPKLELEMPLFLGASEEHMASGAAVLSQTSVPVGGENTNAVIAGHRGYGGYDYFRYIDGLEVGDEIHITNLWETLTYKVSEIRIIDPNDIDAILIQPGREMVTLMTCHPYASGGKYRYLVYCDRADGQNTTIK